MGEGEQICFREVRIKGTICKLVFRGAYGRPGDCEANKSGLSFIKNRRLLANSTNYRAPGV